ncbi:hypothetical protein K6976_04335 [Streptococcus suis]|uniref:hypothetical protein n=1 Tax=Streptococcus suis TaxID=1307 RepID=UPI001C9BE3E5|nr:hypothetical protein [Streptococcus suis]QZS51620.1 hypothetical protein K6976_02050 [Streptococcus suis]QZS52030.1 hypothetical protein K6976_04335 [Streptococcus suis]HEM3522882.1 hypothetical protein [Streptococcus suis]
MGIFNKIKRPLISDDAEEKNKTEAAIVKSIILSKIESLLEEANIERERFSITHGSAIDPVLSDRIAWNMGREQILSGFREYVKLIPDSLYRIQRKGAQALEINGLDGSCLKLSLSRKAIGGNIYQLKDSVSSQSVDIISSENFDYLDDIERSCINGYLIPDEKLFNALSQLRETAT